jgi:hypothetical protein
MPTPKRILWFLAAVALTLAAVLLVTSPQVNAQNPFPSGDPHWSYPVASSASLPATAVWGVGEVHDDQSTGTVYTWTGTAWQKSYTRAGLHGESAAPFLLWEHLVLSTSGVTTTGAGNLLPASSLIDHVDCVVTATVSGSGVTGLQVGDGTTVDRFLSAGALALTVGSKAIGWNIRRPAYATTDAKGPTQATLAQVAVTAVGGTPTAGAVSCSSFGSTITAPAS